MKYVLNRTNYGDRAAQPEGDPELGVAPTAAAV
jgi:hypothetical protein